VILVDSASAEHSPRIFREILSLTCVVILRIWITIIASFSKKKKLYAPKINLNQAPRVLHLPFLILHAETGGRDDFVKTDTW
jgi:hypothetical protein